MTNEPAPDSPHPSALLAAEALLQRLFPSSTPFTRAEVQQLTLQAGVWALNAEVQRQGRNLPQQLTQQLGVLRRPPPAPAVRPPSSPPVPVELILTVRKRCEALGQPWRLNRPVRDHVTQTSYRIYPALLSRVQALQPGDGSVREYELQLTLALAYLALPEWRHRVDALLRLRYLHALTDAATQRNPDALAVAAVLADSGLPWRGRQPLRQTTKQVAMRVTTALADALKTAPPADLRCTIADLHTTLLALYVADDPLRAQMDMLLRARQRT
ncbi:hypothetical protein [Deinococcus sonorensis]|uniref:Uncharacterized protein n=2 Tax=Deinococcus sonorensis TaxID=309891 RepID=A0AAU7UCG6_9DEIO